MQLAESVLIVLACVGVAEAQTKLGFKVVDATKNKDIAIPGASCSLYNIKGNELVLTATSSKSGQCFDIAFNFTGFHKLRLSHPKYFVYERQLNAPPPMQIGLVPR